MTTDRTPPKKKARELAKYFRAEQVDYPYLKSVFRALREELEIQVPRSATRLPEVPSEEEIRRFYQAVWNCRNFADMVLIKTLFYTGVRVSELVAIRLDEVDVERCQIRITQGKGHKDRLVCHYSHIFAVRWTHKISGKAFRHAQNRRAKESSFCGLDPYQCRKPEMDT